MLGPWTGYPHGGNPKFSSPTANPLTINNDSVDDRGTWLAWWDGEIKAGDRFIVKGTWSVNAQPLVVFYFGGNSYGTLPIPDDRVVTLPNSVVRLRLDGRLWNTIGEAWFKDYDLIPYDDALPPEPPSEIPNVYLEPIINPENSYAFNLVWTSENLPDNTFFFIQHMIDVDIWESFAMSNDSPFPVEIDRLGEQCFRIIAVVFSEEFGEQEIAVSELQCTLISELPFPVAPSNTEARGFSGKKFGSTIVIEIPGDDVNPNYEEYLEVYGYLVASQGFFQIYNSDTSIG